MSRVIRKILSAAAGLATMATLAVAVAPASSAVTGSGDTAVMEMPVAATSAKPALGLTAVHSAITAGAAPQFRYTSARAPKGAVIVLQRQFGTSHVWATVRRFKVGNGVTTAPKLSPLGRYAYRLALMKGSTYVAFSAARVVYAYGAITLGALCARSRHTYFDGDCAGSTIQVGGNVFEYLGGQSYNTGPNGDPEIGAQNSSCRSITLRYAVENGGNAQSLGVSLVQTRADEQDSTSVPNVIKTATFTIRSSSWDLSLWSDNSERVYYNGTASCWTSSGDA